MIKEKQETIKIKICDLCGEEIDVVYDYSDLCGCGILDGYEGDPTKKAKFQIHYKCLDKLILKHISEKK